MMQAVETVQMKAFCLGGTFPSLIFFLQQKMETFSAKKSILFGMHAFLLPCPVILHDLEMS
jgi:hypothetical protein